MRQHYPQRHLCSLESQNTDRWAPSAFVLGNDPIDARNNIDITPATRVGKNFNSDSACRCGSPPSGSTQGLKRSMNISKPIFDMRIPTQPMPLHVCKFYVAFSRMLSEDERTHLRLDLDTIDGFLNTGDSGGNERPTYPAKCPSPNERGRQTMAWCFGFL